MPIWLLGNMLGSGRYARGETFCHRLEHLEGRESQSVKRGMHLPLHGPELEFAP